MNDNITKNINILPKIDLGGTIIPSSPFIWYREDHIVCPFELIVKIKSVDMIRIIKKLSGNNFNLPLVGDYYLIIQRNVLTNAKLYISYHSYVYYKLYEATNKTIPEIIKIPRQFNRCYDFSVNCIPLSIDSNDHGFKCVPGRCNIKDGAYVNGPVHIHDEAFSPPESFKFSVDEKKDVIWFLAHGYSQKVENTGSLCLFILINENGKNNIKTEDIIKKIDY